MSFRVAEIEQQLREIWKGFSETGHKGDAVTRAQVMNLIAYSSSKDADAQISQILAGVSVENPGRMIVLIRDRELPESVINSWVNALCHIASGGRQQVCCEQIVIHAGERDPFRWSSVVLPLIVPDVPVFLWWNDPPHADLPLLNAILEATDRLILDSSLASDFNTIVELMQQHGEWLAISDLNWARLTPWRQAIAGFYDHLACGRRLQEIHRIEIVTESNSEQTGSASLLIGWFASGLGWKRAGKSGLHNAQQMPVAVNIDRRPGASDRLLEVNLLGPDAKYSVSLMEDSLHLQTRATIRNKDRGTQVVKLPDQTLSGLIRREVSILGRDEIYEKSLRFLTDKTP